MLSHVFSLGTHYAKPSSVPIPQPQEGCLIVFPNYVTGFLMGVECALKSRKQVEQLLKLAHAERFYEAHPPQTLTEAGAAKRLDISVSTLQAWARKGWIYRWDIPRYCGHVYSNAEVQALRLARPRSL